MFALGNHDHPILKIVEDMRSGDHEMMLVEPNEDGRSVLFRLPVSVVTENRTNSRFGSSEVGIEGFGKRQIRVFLQRFSHEPGSLCLFGKGFREFVILAESISDLLVCEFGK